MRILNVRMPIEACALGTPRGKDERFTSSPMGLDPDSIDLFPDNLSGALIFARPRDHSSRYLSSFRLETVHNLRRCRPNERTWPFLNRVKSHSEAS